MVKIEFANLTSLVTMSDINEAIRINLARSHAKKLNSEDPELNIGPQDILPIIKEHRERSIQGPLHPYIRSRLAAKN